MSQYMKSNEPINKVKEDSIWNGTAIGAMTGAGVGLGAVGLLHGSAKQAVRNLDKGLDAGVPEDLQNEIRNASKEMFGDNKKITKNYLKGSIPGLLGGAAIGMGVDYLNKK